MNPTSKQLKRVAWLILWLTFTSGVLAQSLPLYRPTPEQEKDLKIAFLTAVNARLQLEQAQQSYQNAMTSLVDQGNKIKKENKWGDEVLFDPNMGVFSAAPKKEEPKK